MTKREKELTPEKRYSRDVHFRSLVDNLYMAIHQAKYTPTELREAVILAAIMYDQHHPRPSIFWDEDNEMPKHMEKP